MIPTTRLSFAWWNLDETKLSPRLDLKFLDRKKILTDQYNLLSQYIPEYMLHIDDMKILRKTNVLDIACGSGAMLEIMRFYGHDIQGMDYCKEYEPLLQSQEIPVVWHDATKPPYPFKDEEFDMVICLGAFHYFKPVSVWEQIICEFQRISRQTVLISINRGRELEEGRDRIEGRDYHGWKTNKLNDHTWKFEKIK